MRRVTGNAELYVDVDWPTRTVRLFGAGKASLLWMAASASASLRGDLQQAEWQLEGVAGAMAPPEGLAAVDAAAGTITVVRQTFSAVQSEHLRALLEQAEQALAAGYGWA